MESGRGTWIARAGRFARETIVIAAATVGIFLLVEGLSSTILFVKDLHDHQYRVAERAHTRFDPELGWVNLPNMHIPDMYGPHIGLSTNQAGFRSTTAFSQTPATGKIRIVCSGDSFTMGVGVDDENNWCQLLASRNSDWETVNMGQGGYGVDQMYLWYRRDGIALGQRVHLFAFVWPDFIRMQSDRFLGYGKPTLEVQNGKLITRNVPVPRDRTWSSWFIMNRKQIYEQVKSLALMSRIASKFMHPAAAPPVIDAPVPGQKEVLATLIGDLDAVNRAHHISTVLVYLPMIDDYTSDTSKVWRDMVREQAAHWGVPLIDLADEFRSVPREDVVGMFLTTNWANLYEIAGHYSNRGNLWVAERVAEHLKARELLFASQSRAN